MTDAMPTDFTTYDDFVHLRFERPSPPVLLITIDRPEVLNAANERLHREFSEVWRVVDRDDSVAVSVITGSGRAFSAGGDLDMVERMTSDYATTLEQWRDAKAVVDEMLTSVKPIVSAINGVAVGAGLAVARPDIIDTLVQRLAPGGEIVLAGFYDTLSFSFPPAFMREARIRIAAQWGEGDLETVRRLVEDGRLSLDGLVTHRRPASEASAAYPVAFDDPGCLKMVLDWRSRA